MDGMEKLIYVHVLKAGESVLDVPGHRESGYYDSTNCWYVIKGRSNGSVEISPVFEDIKPLNYPDAALQATSCQVIGSCIYEIGGLSIYSRIDIHRLFESGSSKIRCLDTHNPKDAWQNCFTLPSPVHSVQSAVVDDQWLYLLGGGPLRPSDPFGYALNVDDFSKEKLKEISKPHSSASSFPVVAGLSPGTLVAYFENEGTLHQLDCTNNTWTLLLENLPRCGSDETFLGMSTISDGVLYIVDTEEMRFITYDIHNKKQLPEVVLPSSFLWGYRGFVNLVVVAKNKFCIMWDDYGSEIDTMNIYYIRFSVSYDLPNPTVVAEERKCFKAIGGIGILNVVAVNREVKTFEDDHAKKVPVQIFEDDHARKELVQTFEDDHAKKVSEQYPELIREHVTEADVQSTPKDKHSAFLEAANGVEPDGHIYGCGSQAPVIFESEIQFPRGGVSLGEIRRENEQLRSEVEMLRELLKTQERRSEDLWLSEKRLKEKIGAFMAEFAAVVTPTAPTLPSLLDRMRFSPHYFAQNNTNSSDFNMDGMEKLIYVHVLKAGESVLDEPGHRESGYYDSTNSWYVIKERSNGSVEISPVFEDIKPLNYPDAALQGTSCQVIGSCIYEIGGLSFYSRIDFRRLFDSGSSQIRCLDTHNPKDGWQTWFTLPSPVHIVRSAVVDDQWLYLLGGFPFHPSAPYGYALNVDDFSKEKVKEISEPHPCASSFPVVASLSPGTLVAYFENEGNLHQLDCTNNTWTLLLENLPRCRSGERFVGMSTISDGVLYIVDTKEMRFISYDIHNKKQLPEVVFPSSFFWGYKGFVSLVVLAKNKFCILWDDYGREIDTMNIYYIKFSVSYDLPNPTVVDEERECFEHIGGVGILNVVAVNHKVETFEDDHAKKVPVQTFEDDHAKKVSVQTFEDDHAKNVSEQYPELIREHVTEAGVQSTPKDKHSAFVEAANEVEPDGTIYGCGSQAPVIFESEIQLPQGGASLGEIRRENEQLRSEVEMLRERLETQERRFEDLWLSEKLLKEKIEAFMAEFAAVVAPNTAPTVVSPSK